MSLVGESSEGGAQKKSITKGGVVDRKSFCNYQEDPKVLKKYDDKRRRDILAILTT